MLVECLQFEVLFQPMYRSVDCVVMDDGEVVHCKCSDLVHRQSMLTDHCRCWDLGTSSSVVKVLVLHWDEDSPYAATCHTDLSVAANVQDSHCDNLLKLAADCMGQHRCRPTDTRSHLLHRRSLREHKLYSALATRIDRLQAAQTLQIHTAIQRIP